MTSHEALDIMGRKLQWEILERIERTLLIPRDDAIVHSAYKSVQHLLLDIKYIWPDEELVDGLSRSGFRCSVECLHADRRFEPVKDFTSRPVEDLDLSVRASNCLFNAPRGGLPAITTVGVLMALTERDLMGIRNFGIKSLQEVRNVLAQMGLSLRPPRT